MTVRFRSKKNGSKGLALKVDPKIERQLRGIRSRGARVLVVDDDDVFRRSMGRLIKDLGLPFEQAKNGMEGLETFKKSRSNVVITDREMPHMGGLELLTRIRAEHPEAEVIVLSGGISEDEIDAFMQAGALAVFEKPHDISELSVLIRMLAAPIVKE